MNQVTVPAAHPQRFPRQYRLRKRGEFLALERAGRRRVTGDFIILTRGRPHPPSRLGLTTSRRVGNAPARNRVRRLVREFFRRHHHALPHPMEILVIARPSATALGFHAVEQQLARALQIHV